MLVCRSPKYVQVEVGNQTLRKAFTLSDRAELLRILTAKFRDGKYDEGLQEAVEFVRNTLKANFES